MSNIDRFILQIQTVLLYILILIRKKIDSLLS